MKVSVIIPSLNPDEKLVSVVDSLIEYGFDDIVLVNDGSDDAHLGPFETVAKYDYPEIYGKSGMRPYDDKKSDFCVKNKVINAFSNLIENANFKHILVSYSNEGIMSINEIEDVLKRFAKDNTYHLVQIPYRRYKHISKNVKHNLHELLFYIEKRKND